MTVVCWVLKALADVRRDGEVNHLREPGSDITLFLATVQHNKVLREYTCGSR